MHSRDAPKHDVQSRDAYRPVAHSHNAHFREHQSSRCEP